MCMHMCRVTVHPSHVYSERKAPRRSVLAPQISAHPKHRHQHHQRRKEDGPSTFTSHPTAMPPRIQATRLAFSLLSIAPKTPAAAPLLVPTHHRCASILSSLSDTKGAYNKKIRRGRGPASGKGKTSGRGQKGQHAHGKVPAHFEGGQTPLSITKPERGRGKYNPFVVDMSPINLDRIQSWIDQGRLDASKPITMRELHKSRCLHGVKRHGVKLLARVRAAQAIGEAHGG
jgi:ribosomal protein L15